MLFITDITKGRRKGSINANHTWVARFTVMGGARDKHGNSKWQYVYPDDKDVAEDISPFGSVTTLEISPKYARESDLEELPKPVRGILATLKQQFANRLTQHVIPAGKDVDPATQDTTPMLHVVRLGQSTYDPEQFKTGDADVRRVEPVVLVHPKKHVRGWNRKEKLTTTVTYLTEHDPRLVAKYGGEEVLQDHLRRRPFATKLTAGALLVNTKNERALYDEWKGDIYGIARAAARMGYVHSKAYRKRYERDEIDGRNPHVAGSAAQSYLNDRAADLAQELAAEFVQVVRKYDPKIDDPNDRFDKLMLSRMKYGAKHIVDRELRDQGVQVPLDVQEAHDVNSRHLSAVDVADYKRYAPVAVHHLESAMKDLPEAQRRVIEMRLWLDSPQSQKEERKQVASRVGRTEESSWEAPDAAATHRALKHFERSFSEIAMKQPTWREPGSNDATTFDVKNSDPKIAAAELKRATNKLEFWYRTGLKTLLSKFTTGKRHLDNDHAEDVIHDHRTGHYFTPEGYAVYRWLDVATKLARSVRPKSMPAASELEVKHEQIQQRVMRPHSVTVAARYPEIEALERHPVLLSRMPHLTPGAPAAVHHNVLVPPLPAPLPRKYGLPETHTKNRLMRMSPEQERRYKVIQQTHQFLNHVGGMRTKDVAKLSDAYDRGVTRVHQVVGKSPEHYVQRLRSELGKLTHKDASVRQQAKGSVKKLVEGLHEVAQRLKVDPITDQVVAAVSQPLEDRKQHLSALPLDEHVTALSQALQRVKDEAEVLRYTKESRSGTVKAMPHETTVETFLLLVEEYDQAIDAALARIAA